MRNYYQAFYDEIASEGNPSIPRGQMVTEVKNTTFIFHPGDVFTRKGGNPTIGFIEALQFIGGTFDIRNFERWTPNARLDLFTSQSAYGPRTYNNFAWIVNELLEDPMSRRAVLTIARPSDVPETMPCTTSIQFQISSLGLVTSVTMRSNDLVWGLPTDMIQFGAVSQMIANCLGVRKGYCVVRSGNTHIYDDTKLTDGEEFSVYGTFSIPILRSVDSYRTWALSTINYLNRSKDERPMDKIFNIRRK